MCEQTIAGYIVLIVLIGFIYKVFMGREVDDE